VAGQLASGVAARSFGPPRCKACDRLLVTAGVDRYVCPCCGELFMMIEHLLGLDCPDGDGAVRTNMAMNRAGHLTELPPRHLCPPAKRSTRNPDQLGLFDQKAR
jgi:hypothetical protein